MTDTLATFADQVTTWRAKWASKGRLGGRQCAGRRRTWKDLRARELLAAN